jgi:hypothetical protein
VAAATKPAPEQRRKRQPRQMFMPYDKDAVTIVQPPAFLAEVTDDDEAFEILTDPVRYEAHTGAAPEQWDLARFRAEVGRSEGRVKVWQSNQYAVNVHGVDPSTIEDRILCKPDGYDKRSPYWLSTTARKWAIAEGIMTRRGVFIPYRPPGRPKGRTDSVPRQRRATMKATALEFLAAAEKLTAAGATAGEAKTTLAGEYGITERAVKRRLTEARAMRAAGVRTIDPDMTPDEVGQMIAVTYRLIMADGRRSNTERAREDVAERLGVDLDVVERAVVRFGEA